MKQSRASRSKRKTVASSEIKAQAVERVRRGESKAQVARELDQHPKTVARWCAAAGLKPAFTGTEGRWVKGQSGNPDGVSLALKRARAVAQMNAEAALVRLQHHADRLERILDDGESPTMGQSMTASELTRVLKVLASPALTPEKSTVEVQHSGGVQHDHRVTVEPAHVGSALDILADLGAIPAPPAPSPVDPS